MTWEYDIIRWQAHVLDLLFNRSISVVFWPTCAGSCCGGMACWCHGKGSATRCWARSWTWPFPCCKLCVPWAWQHEFHWFPVCYWILSTHFSKHGFQRYQLGEWFNFVEATGRYMDEQSIRNTSVACEALANWLLQVYWFDAPLPHIAIILPPVKDQSLNSYYCLAKQAVDLGMQHLFPIKPKCHVPCHAHVMASGALVA